MFHQTINLLEQSLHYAKTKNQAISHNIANVDTPGYQAKNVSFNKVLENQINSLQAKKTHEKHLSFSQSVKSGHQTIQQRNTLYNHNRNNLDMDKEMAKLAENQLYYEATVDRLKGEFNQIKTVIRGGN